MQRGILGATDYGTVTPLLVVLPTVALQASHVRQACALGYGESEIALLHMGGSMLHDLDANKTKVVIATPE